MESLAVRYRPKTWSDVCEQESVRKILQHQIATNTIKNAYLFCGSAGCGKTTVGRIFAREINKGKGEPIEIDAASHNSVDDVRTLTQQANTQSLDSEYRCYIIDECHSLSNNAWQAFLKTLEEPPKKSVFIFCTTNPEKIPATILSRVQRYDFKKLSQQAIVDRLKYIIDSENGSQSDKLEGSRASLIDNTSRQMPHSEPNEAVKTDSEADDGFGALDLPFEIV